MYAYNWYDIGAVLPLIGATFGIGTAQLGIVLGAFLVGVGIFQIPAGIATIRWGARRVTIFALALMGLSSLATALPISWEWLASTRFVEGVGAAFFFAPGLALVSTYFPAERRGPVIGLYNGGFSIGGAVGLVGAASLGILVGWPVALAIGGAGLLVMAFLAILLLPETERSGTAVAGARSSDAVRRVLRSRAIWALALALTGFWAAVYAVAQYFVQFVATVHPGWGVGVASALAAGFVVISFPGGPLGGWLAERAGNRGRLLAVFALVEGLLVLTIPFASLVELWPILLSLGLLDGVIFAILYVIPTYLSDSAGEGVALGVGFINSVQVLLGSGLAVAFGFVASQFGFTLAWVSSAAIAVALLPLLRWVPSDARPLGPTSTV